MNRNILIFVLLLLAFEGFSQKSSTQNSIDVFVNQEIFKSASIGMEIRDLKTGKLLGEHLSEKSLTPASSQKLITTAAALELLGSDFHFETEFHYDGILTKSGILNGNLIVKGMGDPCLGSKYFKDEAVCEQLAQVIRALGIKSIKGKLIVDTDLFKAEIPRTWIWEDIGNYYGAVPHALTYKDNSYILYFSSQKAGQLTNIKQIDNKQADLEFSNEVLSSTINRDKAYIFGGNTSNKRRVEGTIPQNQSDFKVKGALSKPDSVFAHDFENALSQLGIKFEKNDLPGKTSELLFLHLSPSLGEIVTQTNLKSINLFADHLLFQLAIKQNYKGNWESGIKTVKNFWESKGIDSKGLFLFDGSGLSHFNAISTRALNQVLIHMSKSKNAQIFFNSLPVSGKSGTLKHFGKYTKLADKFKAKTGSMTGVRSYSGILSKKNGQEIAISLIINDYSCDSKVFNEKLEDLLVELTQ